METIQGDRSELYSKTTTSRTIELYLSQDILQGERVPFYLTWKGVEVSSIELSYLGFKSITRFHNVRRPLKTNSGAIIQRRHLKMDGYLGGVLATIRGASPQEEASLEATLHFIDGSSKKFLEHRNIFSARGALAVSPEKISVPLKKGEKKVLVDVSGAATVIISIEKASQGVELTLPPEVLTAMERFGLSFVEGMKHLQKEYPQYEEILSNFMDEKRLESYSQYVHYAETQFAKLRSDEAFMEAIAYVMVSAILSHESLRDSVLIPLTEYTESNAAVKAFLDSPFLCAKVPPGGARLRCRLMFRDLLGHTCGKPILVDTRLESETAGLVPLKEIIGFRRI